MLARPSDAEIQARRIIALVGKSPETMRAQRIRDALKNARFTLNESITSPFDLMHTAVGGFVIDTADFSTVPVAMTAIHRNLAIWKQRPRPVVLVPYFVPGDATTESDDKTRGAWHAFLGAYDLDVNLADPDHRHGRSHEKHLIMSNDPEMIVSWLEDEFSVLAK